MQECYLKKVPTRETRVKKKKTTERNSNSCSMLKNNQYERSKNEEKNY